jgi:hypothetical protein
MVPPIFDPPATGVVLSRLCSADLPLESAFYNERTHRGYRGRIFMDGEEVGNEGRGFAHLMNGTSFQLPRLGRFSWENSVANPSTGDKTVVVGTDDSTPGQVYVYIGTKTNSGSPIDKAGLNNGNLYGVKVDGIGRIRDLHPVGEHSRVNSEMWRIKQALRSSRQRCSRRN